MTVQLPTPALPKRLSLSFLWEEFSQRAPIPIVNSLHKTVRVFGGQWVAHSYLDSPNYNKITNNFQNRLSLLVLTCLQCYYKLNGRFEKIIYECGLTLIVDDYLHVFFLTY